MLKTFAKTMHEHLSGILAYYDYPISTAALEKALPTRSRP